MEGQTQYFVIFTPQKGETSPAYSFMDAETLITARNQGIVIKVFDVPPAPVHSKEEVLELLRRYQNEK